MIQANLTQQLLFFAVLGGLLLTFSSCSVEQPEVIGIQEVAFVSLRKDILTLAITPIIRNPNSVGIRLAGLDAEVQVAGEVLGTGTSNDAIEIPGNSDTPVALNVDIKTQQFKRRILGLLQQERVELDVASNFHVEIQGKRISLPYSYQQTVNPKVELARLLLSL